MSTDNAKTVLIVDDSKVSRMMTKLYILRKFPDWNVLEANNGEDALKMAPGAASEDRFHGKTIEGSAYPPVACGARIIDLHIAKPEILGYVAFLLDMIALKHLQQFLAHYTARFVPQSGQ